MTKIKDEIERRNDMELRKWCVERARDYMPTEPVVDAAGQIYRFVTAGGEYVRDAKIINDGVGPELHGFKRKQEPVFDPHMAAKCYERTAEKVQHFARNTTATEDV